MTPTREESKRFKVESSDRSNKNVKIITQEISNESLSKFLWINKQWLDLKEEAWKAFFKDTHICSNVYIPNTLVESLGDSSEEEWMLDNEEEVCKLWHSTLVVKDFD